MHFRALSLVSLLVACVASSRELLGGSAAMVKACKPEINSCTANPVCKAMTICISLECAGARTKIDPGPRIKKAQALAKKLGQPYNAMICDKSCFDDYGYGNPQWEAVAACGGRAGAIRSPASASQQCQQHPQVLQPFNMSALSGQWWKVWAHGWDFWRCHRHIFTFNANTPTWRETWEMETKFQLDRHPEPIEEGVKVLAVPNQDDLHGNMPGNASFTILPYFHMGADSYESWYVLAMTEEYAVIAACVYTIELARTDAVTFVLAKTPTMSGEVEAKVRQQLVRLDMNASTMVTVNNTKCMAPQQVKTGEPSASNTSATEGYCNDICNTNTDCPPACPCTAVSASSKKCVHAGGCGDVCKTDTDCPSTCPCVAISATAKKCL